MGHRVCTRAGGAQRANRPIEVCHLRLSGGGRRHVRERRPEERGVNVARDAGRPGHFNTHHGRRGATSVAYTFLSSTDAAGSLVGNPIPRKARAREQYEERRCPLTSRVIRPWRMAGIIREARPVSYWSRAQRICSYCSYFHARRDLVRNRLQRQGVDGRENIICPAAGRQVMD
jgi:hypothetical protein